MKMHSNAEKMVGRMVGKLTASGLKKLSEGRHADGGGLYLQVRNGARGWLFRYQSGTRRREMALGSYPAMSLALARAARDDAAQMRAKGLDPLDERARSQNLSFRQATEQAFEARKRELKSDGEAGRWLSPLKVHVLPKIGARDVASITQRDLHDVLKPIWHSKTSVAEKALQRAAIVLKHAAALGLDADLQAAAKARALLGDQGHKPEHIPAMPWQDVPAFYKSLGTGPADLALRLTILTASRSAPVRFAAKDQFEGDTWTIPAERMKGRRGQTDAFRVPLAPAAQAVVAEAAQYARGDLLFASRDPDKPISDMTMTAILRRRELPFRPHGFRSSFRDWCEETGQPWHLAELSLSHAVGNKVERSYRRNDLLDQRRGLLEAWAGFVTGAATAENVVQLRG